MIVPRTSAILATFAVLTTVSAAAHAGVSGANIASIALANVGDGACSTNSGGTQAYETSCDGNGGQPEYWCADFVQWVWAQAGADVADLDAAAGTFYCYGQNHGTLSDTPAVGDAVVFDEGEDGDCTADHVAIVTQVNADGTIETVSGDWGGTGATEAAFSSTSAVVFNTPAYASTVGTVPSIMGMTISGFIAPIALGGDAGSGGDGVGTACTVTATGAMGVCQDTTTCASMGGTSTADYCPGPDNVECCTGVPVDAGAAPTPEAGPAAEASTGSDAGAVTSADSGAPVVTTSSDDAGSLKPPPAHATDAGAGHKAGSGTGSAPSDNTSDDADDDTAGSTGGCSVTARDGDASVGGLWVAGLGLIALVRRKRAARG